MNIQAPGATAIGVAVGVAKANAVYGGAIAAANASGIYGAAASTSALATLGGGAVAAGGGGMLAGVTALCATAATVAVPVGIITYLGMAAWRRFA